MRRKDREVTDVAEILDIIDRCEYCRLALSEDDEPYVFPINFGYKHEDGVLTLYFHSAREGRKLDIIRKNPLACVEMDCSYKVVVNAEACDFSAEYESVIGSGKIEILTDEDERREGLLSIMHKVAPGESFNLPENKLRPTEVFKLTVSEFTGKRNIIG